MKNIIKTTLGMFVGISSLMAQQQEIKVEKFDKANLCCGADYKLVQSSTENKVVISTDDFDKKAFSVIVSDGVLNISNTKSGERTATIYFTDLNTINLTGASDLFGDDTINTKIFTINSSGASDVNLKFNAEHVVINSSGASDTKLTGKATNLNLVGSGASEIDAKNMEAVNAIVVLSGSSEAEINVKNSVTGTLTGASELELMQEPVTKNIKTTGASSVEIGDNDDNDGDKKSDGDTTNLSMGNYDVKIIKKEKTENLKNSKDEFTHSWAGFDLAMNGLLYNNSMNLPAKYDFMELNQGRSWNFSLNFVEKDLNINKEYINLVTGLGLEFSNYNLKNNYNLVNTTSLAAFYDSTRVLDKNKLRSTYLNVPLLVEFNTHKDKKKSFHFATGIVGGVRLGTTYKQMIKTGDERQKFKNKDDYSMEDFKVMATVRVGYGNFNAFVNYGLNDLFKSGKGPNLTPVTAGITLIPF